MIYYRIESRLQKIPDNLSVSLMIYYRIESVALVYAQSAALSVDDLL